MKSFLLGMADSAGVNSGCSSSGSSSSLFIGTWNLAGLAVLDCDLFIAQLSDNYKWDFLLLQETFVCADGLELESKHVVFTGSDRDGDCRLPGVLVHERWASNCRVVGEGSRWLAVRVSDDLLLISLHLPHQGKSLDEFAHCLHDVDAFLDTQSCKHVCLGMDANVKACDVVDGLHVGENVLLGTSSGNYDRSILLLEFLCKHQLYLTNTFGDVDPTQRATRFNWNGEGASQIDFLATSWTLSCLEISVDQVLEFRSDHRLVYGCFHLLLELPAYRRVLSLRNWKPSETWNTCALSLPWNWHDWETTSGLWRDAASKNRVRGPKAVDDVLRGLLLEHKTAGVARKRVLNKQIWRRRRFFKRQRAKESICNAANLGRFPDTQRKNVAVNWAKLCGSKEPSTVLTDFYTDIYSLDFHTLTSEVRTKEERILVWRSLRIDVLPFHVTLERLSTALKKLKFGKGSPDGCTAEMFRALPTTVLLQLCSFFTHILATLEFPESWSAVGASLIPKVVGASTLGKFRAIACLPVARKLLGYIWLQMLPTLHFASVQCGFVAGSHAANGVYVVKRAAELSKEWKIPLFAAQLDLKKAFDRVLHSALLNALRSQGASVQCLAVAAALLKQSTAKISLGHVASANVTLNRGLPQGAPESPLIFVLVTDMVLQTLMRVWKERGSGWSFSGLYISAICYADDIILLSSSKKDLELMISEVIDAFLRVGLEVGTDKSHWSSCPAKANEKLRFGSDRVKWEQNLTFVGTILDLSGSDAGAVEYRIAQATKVFQKWKAILATSAAPLPKRLDLTAKTVFTAALWLSECWHPTKRQQKRLDSWGARIAAQVAGVRPRADEDVATFWRRLYRTGHELWGHHGGNLNARRRMRLHSFAGHLARMEDGLAHDALRTRSLGWWRHFQNTGSLAHPRRFHVWRWESQLAEFYGEAPCLFIDENVGWMAAAQSRSEWRSQADDFARS